MIYGELVGYGVQLERRQPDRPIRRRLSGSPLPWPVLFLKSGMIPEDVDYIAAHGTSTLKNDATETLVAIKRVFGNPTRPVCSSRPTKARSATPFPRRVCRT